MITEACKKASDKKQRGRIEQATWFPYLNYTFIELAKSFFFSEDTHRSSTCFAQQAKKYTFFFNFERKLFRSFYSSSKLYKNMRLLNFEGKLFFCSNYMRFTLFQRVQKTYSLPDNNNSNISTVRLYWVRVSVNVYDRGKAPYPYP